MFLENLKQLLSNKEHPAPTTTEKEIREKEKELGIDLPESVRQLYLNVSTKDPLFSNCFMIPVDEWMPRTVDDRSDLYQVLPIFAGEKTAFGPAVSVEPKDTFTNTSTYSNFAHKENRKVYGLSFNSKFPKRNPQKPIPIKKNIYIRSISNIMLPLIASQIAKNAKSIILADYDASFEGYEWFKKAFTPLPDQKDLTPYADVCRYNGDPSVWALNNYDFIRVSFDLPNCYDWVVWADSDQPLEKLIKESGIRFEWYRSQNGNVTPTKTEPVKEIRKIPKERPLLSIAPILKYIHDFAGITGTYTTKEQIEKAEKRLGNELPLPLKEFYEYLPNEYFTTYNTIRRISNLRKRKNGKIVFLEENQYVFLASVEIGSCYVYEMETDDDDKIWNPVGILDGYLAAEFLQCIIEDKLPGLSMGEWCSSNIKPSKAQLLSFFTDIEGISDKIAEGNKFHLYDVCHKEGIALYNEENNYLLLYAKGEDNLIELERKIGLTDD